MTILATSEARMAERLRTALAFAGVGAWEWDLRTGEAWWSDHLYSILGRSPGQIRTTLAAFLECVAEEDAEVVRGALREVLRTGESRALSCRVVRPDRSVRWCRGLMGAVPDESGHCRLILGTLRDLTDEEAERRAPEETLLRALREQRTELLTVLEATPRPLLLVDSMQRILRTNRATERMFGWRAGDLTGRPLSVLVADPGELLDALLVAATARDAEHVTRVIAVRSREGRTFAVEMTVVAAPASDGARFVVMCEPVGVSGTETVAAGETSARPLAPLEASSQRA